MSFDWTTDRLSTPCIEHQGWRHKQGYGRVRLKGSKKCLLAHRVAWEKVHGPIPPRAVIRHKCDNPPCINVEHLEIGTQSDNMRDALLRGRVKTRLSADTVVEIRRLYAAGVTQAEIAKRFSLRTGYVCHLVHRKIWKHV